MKTHWELFKETIELLRRCALINQTTDQKLFTEELVQAMDHLLDEIAFIEGCEKARQKMEKKGKKK